MRRRRRSPDGLRGLLQKSCDPSVVRAAEEAADGRSPDLEKALDGFGLWDLPTQAGRAVGGRVGARAGRSHLSRIVERAAVGAGSGLPRVLWGECGWAPGATLRSCVRGETGDLVKAAVGAPRRTTAGDLQVVR